MLVTDLIRLRSGSGEWAPPTHYIILILCLGEKCLLFGFFISVTSRARNVLSSVFQDVPANVDMSTDDASHRMSTCQPMTYLIVGIVELH